MDIILMMIISVGSYLFLARFFKIWSTNVQLHSVCHCVMASLLTSYALYIISEGNLFSLQFCRILANVDDANKGLFLLAAVHSSGYFIADTIDIFIDYTNEKRRVYVFHHLVALMGISTVHWDYYLCLYGIWALELGGVVHHLRHATKVYSNSYFVLIAGEVLYHLVYVLSRIFLFVNTTIGLWNFRESKMPMLDAVCFVTVYVLIIQNTIWWWTNVQKLLTEPLEGSHSPVSPPTSADRVKQL